MKTKMIVLNKKNIYLVLILLLLILLFIYAMRQISINTMNIDPIYKGSEESKKIAFGCNVVWGNECLPDMLRILRENSIKITFFIGGDWASKNEKLLNDIYNEGHEIGNHGYSHLKQSQISAEKNKSEVLKTEEVINKLIGVKTTLFAPPYGDINDKVVRTVEELNYRVIMWSIDTIDWNTKDYNKILERINKKHHNGAIVLMHPKMVTVQALPIMIKELQAKGYEIVPVSNILE